MLQQLLMNREDFLKTVEEEEEGGLAASGGLVWWGGQGGQEQDISAPGPTNRGLGGWERRPDWPDQRTC